MSATCSLPQGSTLGPLLYVTYASELQDVADRHGVGFHGYTDDTQLSKSVRVQEACLTKQEMIDCVVDIQRWSTCMVWHTSATKKLYKNQTIPKL